jgi:hypothetical protein
MEDWEIVSIEAELDRMRDEKEKSAPAQSASSSKSGCGKVVLFGLGILIIKLFGEFLAIFFNS